MTHKITVGAALVGLFAGLSACSVESNDPKPHEAVGGTTAPLLGLPTIGLPGVFYYTGVGLNAAALAGQLVAPNLTMIADGDILTWDDAGSAPPLSDFPQAVDILGQSYRQVGAYVDANHATIPVTLRNGTVASRPFLRYVGARGGAVLRKSSGTGSDSSAIVASGTTLNVVVVTWADVPTSLSTLPLDVPALDSGWREPVGMLWKCPGVQPNTQACVDSPTGAWITLSANSSDLLFATSNGMSFRADGTAADANQYFMLNSAGTAYEQVVYSGTAFEFSEQDYAYLQTNYGYASWTPLLADSVPWFFSRQ